MANNMVIAGDYEGKGVGVSVKGPFISIKLGKMLILDKSSLESYEVITEETQKSAASGVARGLVGGALLGPVGMLAGGLSAKNKKSVVMVLQFKDGKKSLVEVTDNVYKAIMQKMF